MSTEPERVNSEQLASLLNLPPETVPRPAGSPLTPISTSSSFTSHGSNGTSEKKHSRREINQILRRTNEALTAIVEGSPLAIIAFDCEFNVLLWNPAAEKLFGQRAEEVMTRKFELMWNEKSQDKALMQAFMEHGEPITGIEITRHDKKGRKYELSVSAAPIRDDSGRVNAVLAVLADISPRKEAELVLRESEERFRNLVQSSTDVITIVERDSTIRYASPAAQRVLGYSEVDGKGLSFFDFVHPADRQMVEDSFHRLIQDRELMESVAFRTLHGNGTWRDVECIGNNLLDDPAINGLVFTTRDVTERKHTEQLVNDQAMILELIARGKDLSETLTEMCRIVESSAEDARCVVMLVDDDGQRLHVGAAPNMTRGFIEAVDNMQINTRSGPTPAAVASGETIVVTQIDKDGRWHDLKSFAREHGFGGVWATPIVASSGEHVLGALTVYYQEAREPSEEHQAIVDTVTDLATIALERKAFEASLAHAAHHDPLTGLPNRALFLEFLSLALARSRRYRNNVAVLFLDLDRFKVVNDSLGHDAGDELLIAMARRLESVVRPGDTIARFGGDEFTILCEDLSSTDARQQAIDVAERLLEVIHQPFTLSGDDAFLGASIGIALSGANGVTADGLLRDADAAMYRAKDHGKGRWELFDENMRAVARQRLEIENDLHRALQRNEFEVHYQPIISIEEGRCVGAEALVRWQHPVRGLMVPEDFIPLAEETGLIVPIGTWVLNEVCQQAALWSQEAELSESFVISINLSARQLAQPDLVSVVAASLRNSGIDPQSICLEITESVLMDDTEWSIRSVRALKELGVRLSIDDFGTGYSSLGYLKRFPVDSVKVDQSFVSGLGTDSEDAVIVTAVVSMGHALGLKVVAEGVETELQLEKLVSLGCDAAQGFFFAKPQLPHLVEELVTPTGGWQLPGAAVMAQQND